MTIRDLIISFGYAIDSQAEKKVNASIESLKKTASKALGATDVSYKVDKTSEKKATESIEKIGEAAETIKSNEVGFEVNEESQSIAFGSIEDLQDAAQLLKDNEVGFEVNETEQALVFDSIDDLQEAAAVLENNTVGYEVDRASEARAKSSIRSIRLLATKLLGVIGIGFSFVAMGRLSEEFGSINDQIRDATRGMGDQLEIQQRIKRAANDARQDYATMADTVTRLAQNTEVFDSIEGAASFATLMAQDFAGAAISQQKSAYLTRYIAMDLQKGSVSSRTLTTALRDAPHIAIRLADSLGTTVDGLQDMARAGELSADILKNSFLDSADDIGKRFGEIDMSISDALRNVRNGWGLFVAEMDSTLGISRALARIIVNGFNQVLFVLRRGQNAFIRLGERVGGVNNLIRLLLISASAIFAALNAGKILSFLRSAGGILLKIKAKV